MGKAEKALLRVGGRPIAERTAGILGALCADVLVATPRPEPWAALPVRVVSDELPDAGPLGGIAAGLAAARTRWLLVVAGDMPHVDPALLALLCSRALSSGRTVIPLLDDRPEPLHAVYCTDHAERARAALADGARKAWGWLDAGEVEWVDADRLPGAARSLRGVNTREELDAARRAVDAAASRDHTSRA